MSSPMTLNLKQKAAAAALDFVRDGMTVGLGSGSTAAAFIDLLGQKVQRDGWEISAIPASETSRRQAEALGIELIDPDETTHIDVCVDGADEIDHHGNLIKGGGAALLREKIIAQNAERFVVIADGSKDVKTLGRFPLPIEIDRFGFALTIRTMKELLSDLGFDGVTINLRPADNGGFVLSDGGHYVVDARLDSIPDPRAVDEALTMVPGVVTTGLFVGLSPVIILARDSGLTIRGT